MYTYVRWKKMKWEYVVKTSSHYKMKISAISSNLFYEKV